MRKNNDELPKTRDKLTHPSVNLEERGKGFGVASGFERKYDKDASKIIDREGEPYGPIPHGGYFGAGIGSRPFKRGQASFNEEICWFGLQYGANTSGFEKGS